jgi:outer membrane protein
MKKLLVIVTCLFGGIWFNVAGADGIKIGMIDAEKIVKASPQMEVMLEKAKKQFAPQGDKVKMLQRKFAEKVEIYAKAKSKLSKKQRQNYQDEFSVVQKDLYAARMDYQRVMYKAKQEAMQTVLKQIKEIVNKIAKAEKISLVLVKGSIIYHDPGVVKNISDQVIAALKKQ